MEQAQKKRNDDGADVEYDCSFCNGTGVDFDQLKQMNKENPNTMTTKEELDEAIWKDIPGYEGHYQASNLGHVRSYRRGKAKILKPGFSRGYYSVKLCVNKKNISKKVHRLIALAFIGESSLTVNHIDGCKTNNRLSNLEYVSNRENVQHYYRSTNRSLPMGVSQFKDRFRSKICINGRGKFLGSFLTPEEASAAYQGALRRITDPTN